MPLQNMLILGVQESERELGFRQNSATWVSGNVGDPDHQCTIPGFNNARAENCT